MTTSARFLWDLAVLVGWAAVWPTPLWAETVHAPESHGRVDFAREVLPVLEARCFDCHGAERQRAGLRLDGREALLRGGKSGPSVQVGDGAGSLLYQRVATPDVEEVMPPKGDRLTEEQVAVLRAWIDHGAEWPEHLGAASAEVKPHWAYVPPQRPSLPDVREVNWPRNAVDRFVLARLEAEGLAPSPEADRATLIRRLSLDLLGLPPSLAEVDAFLADDEPGAYERVVDRLLASPHYGERWATPWLDLARYADTNGYEKDDRRSNWPYRDWVINALNRDLPFDQFTLEQLAGDLLPAATLEQRVATGFHRNTMTNTEGGTDDEEFRTAAVLDRVNTTFSVWLGTTMACAQCHNHKYDPFTQREYFEAYAFFNQTRDGGKTLDPVLELPTPQQAARRAEVRARIAPLQEQLDTQTPELEAEQVRWEFGVQEHRGTVAAGWQALPPVRSTASNGIRLEPQPDGSLFATAEVVPDTSVYELVVPSLPPGFTAFRVEALTDERLPHRSSGYSLEGDFVLTDFVVTRHAVNGPRRDPTEPPEPEPPEPEATKLEFDRAYADFSEDRFEVHKAVDKDALSGWAIGADQEKNRTNRSAVFLLKSPVEPDADTAAEGTWVIRLKQESIRPKSLLGRFRLSISTAPTASHRAWADVPAGIRSLLEIEPATRTDGQRAALAKHHRAIAPSLEPVRAAIAELRKQEPRDIVTTLVLQAAAEPRVTRVFKRGSFLDPGEEVTANTPAVLLPFPSDAPHDRLGFARWLVAPENPLVGRVTMNRLWAAYFGRGLVETIEDFGTQGDLPSHPELLDWLATEFIRQGWSWKAMHRVVVTSATYRQTARVTPELLERDPYNRWYARGPRFRLEAELLRDAALAVGGLLNPQIGGPSVFPFQPDGVWAMPYSDDRWVMNTNGNQFRRGVYTFARRSFPYAAFGTFDAPSREVCTERRPRTNTPLQALATLNDPAFLAAAVGLARRVAWHGDPDDRSRLTLAFRTVLARSPSERELTVTLALLERARTRFAGDEAAAERLVTQAALPALEQPRTRVTELAAWAVVANVLLNLDEALNRG
jgi:mono/diheme cytochrome c family protein